MKRFYFLLLCCFVTASASCQKDGAEENTLLLTPQVTEIGMTAATISCRTVFTEAELSASDVLFMYAAVENGALSAYEGFTPPHWSLTDGMLSGRLEGLNPQTTYVVYVVVVTDSRFVQSKSIIFSTISEEDPGPGPGPGPIGEPTFGASASSDVTENAATISCSFSYTGDKTVSEVYFLCTSAAGERREAVSVAAGTKSVRITGLAASAEYTFGLYVVIDGKTYSGAKKSFTTLSAPIPGGGARYAGWAELSAEENKPGDYYYAYHMRADAKSIRNYSVCYSASMRCAIWTAMPHHESYVGSVKRTDNWQYDPDISSFVQPNLSSSYKASGDGSFSRGHMVASNERTVSAATNGQTFYYTNMAPQIQNGFNGGIWGTLEGLCDKVMCSDTLYVVTGSYYADKNKTCNDKNGNVVYVPTHFYKVLIRSKSGNTKKPLWELPADQIQCAGWWMDHKVYPAGSSLKPYIKSVAEIEATTGQKFFPNVPNAPKSTVNASDWKM